MAYALDLVQLISPDNDLGPLVALFEDLHPFTYVCFLLAQSELLDVDSHGKHTNVDGPLSLAQPVSNNVTALRLAAVYPLVLGSANMRETVCRMWCA